MCFGYISINHNNSKIVIKYSQLCNRFNVNKIEEVKRQGSYY